MRLLSMTSLMMVAPHGTLMALTNTTKRKILIYMYLVTLMEHNAYYVCIFKVGLYIETGCIHSTYRDRTQQYTQFQESYGMRTSPPANEPPKVRSQTHTHVHVHVAPL